MQLDLLFKHLFAIEIDVPVENAQVKQNIWQKNKQYVVFILRMLCVGTDNCIVITRCFSGSYYLKLGTGLTMWQYRPDNKGQSEGHIPPPHTDNIIAVWCRSVGGIKKLWYFSFNNIAALK